MACQDASIISKEIEQLSVIEFTEVVEEVICRLISFIESALVNKAKFKETMIIRKKKTILIDQLKMISQLTYTIGDWKITPLDVKTVNLKAHSSIKKLNTRPPFCLSDQCERTKELECTCFVIKILHMLNERIFIKFQNNMHQLLVRQRAERSLLFCKKEIDEIGKLTHVCVDDYGHICNIDTITLTYNVGEGFRQLKIHAE